MGANKSSQNLAVKERADDLRKQRQQLELEKQRLEQLALQQHWIRLQLQEEQRRKEVVEKWRREQQQNEAFIKLQRQMKELQVQLQQQLDMEQQKNHQQQQASAPFLTATREFVDISQTCRIQQKVSPNIDNNKRRGPPELPLLPEKASPLIAPAEPAISFVDKKVVPKQRKDLPEAKLEVTRAPKNLTTLQEIYKPNSIPQPVGTEKRRKVNKKTIPNLQKTLPEGEPKPKNIPKLQKTLPEGEPKPKNIPTTYVRRMDTTHVRYKEWSLIDYVSEENSISKAAAENVIKLLESDNNIPFIARYRKSITQGMELDELRNIEKSFESAKMIKECAISLFNDMDTQGKWTPAFHAFVHESRSLADLNHIQSIFETSNTSDFRLRNIADAVIAGENFDTPSDVVQPTIEGLRNKDQVKDGILYAIADTMNKDKRVFDSIKELRSKHAIKIETKIATELYKAPANEDITQKYAVYNNFVSSENDLTTDQILNISNGAAEKVLSVQMNIPTDFKQSFKARCLHLYAVGVNASLLHKELIIAAIDYMYHRWTKFFIRKTIRDEMKQKAENAEMEIILQNIKRLMLASSVGRKVVIGIATTFERICKIAAVSESGDFLDAETINIRHTDDLDNMAKAEKKLIRMVRKYKCTSLAVGNGIGCSKTVNFLESLIKKNAFRPLKVSYTIVDTTGLKPYCCSRAAAVELPGIVESIIAAVSIARRLQDPVAELVKIDESQQQECREKELMTQLNKVIVDLVSFIGVDVNTASVDLLKRVAGLDEEKANSIIKWRMFSGPFTNRNDLKKVGGINDKIFEQCAGFIRIMPETAVGIDGQRVSPESFNYLDQTWIHPESYDVAEAFVASAGCNTNEFGTKAFIFAINLFATQGNATLAEKFDTTEDTIDLIVKALTMERKATIVEAKSDVNVNAITSTSGNRKGKTDIDNLTMETVLTGVVVSIKPYGVFADVGVEKPGLIRKHHMNGTALTVGQRVETIVHNIDRERRVFGLRLVKCI